VITLGAALTRIFSFLLRPFEGGHAYAGIIFISVLTGAVMLLLFKMTSNQKAMKEVKTRIGAYFLEMRLYKDDVSSVMASQGRILRANLGYMKLALLPAVVLIVPVVLIMVQLNLRYAYTGLEPGQTALVKVTLEDGVDPTDAPLTLSAGEGLEKASPSVRIASLGEVDWKIRLTSSGVRTLRLSSDAGEMTFAVSGTRRLVPVYSVMKKGAVWEGLLNPGAPAVPKTMPVKSVEVKYAPMSFDFGLFKLSWLWTFLIISMAFGVVLKLIFGVE
jgi:uncharacterized membrane protein (DUF106 family)